MSTEKKQTEEPFFLEGFAVDAVTVDNLTDKRFTILSRDYRDLKKLNNPEEIERKLVLGVELVETKQQMDYYPNKTSQKTLAKLFKSNDVNTWIGLQAEWELEKTKVAGVDKKVIYVKEV